MNIKSHVIFCALAVVAFIPTEVSSQYECTIPAEVLNRDHEYDEPGTYFSYKVTNLGNANNNGSQFVQYEYGDYLNKVGEYDHCDGHTAYFKNGAYCAVIGTGRKGRFIAVEVATEAEEKFTVDEVSTCVYEMTYYFKPEATAPPATSPPAVSGDPHFQTWSGTQFDYHGICDLVLLDNPGFEGDLGLHVHIRTKQIKQFSYVSSAVLSIGDETLEVMGDVWENLYWINKHAKASLDEGIGGYDIAYRNVNSQQHEFVVDLDNDSSIVMRTFKKFVRVEVLGATEDNFGTSRGLLGVYGSGKMIARDNVTVLEDPNEFGQEWQVLPSRETLFHDVEGPQSPDECEIPVASNLRRRLSESSIGEEEAKVACSGVKEEELDLCLFDVMVTGDKTLAGAY